MNPKFFLKIVLPYLPRHKELELVGGVIAVLPGVLFLRPRTSRMAAWRIVALLIADLPEKLPKSGR